MKKYKNKYTSPTLRGTHNLKYDINCEIDNFPSELKDITNILLNINEKVLSGPMNVISLTLRNVLQNIIENFDDPKFLTSATFKLIQNYSDKFKLFVENENKFQEIFNLDIWDYHDGIGFDIVKFDDNFKYDDGISLSDFITTTYGLDANIFIKMFLEIKPLV